MKKRYLLLLEVDQDLEELDKDEREDIANVNLDNLSGVDAERELENLLDEPGGITIIDARATKLPNLSFGRRLT